MSSERALAKPQLATAATYTEVESRIAAELPPQALGMFSGLNDAFYGLAPHDATRSFRTSATSDAKRVDERVASYRFSDAPGALEFDRDSFLGMEINQNTRSGESLLGDLTPANWAKFLDASYRERVVKSFAGNELPEIPITLTAVRRKLLPGRDASEITHPTLGKLIEIVDTKSGKAIAFIGPEESGNLIRLLLPTPDGTFFTLRHGNVREPTDLVSITVEKLPNGSIRLASASPVLGDGRPSAAVRERIRARSLAWEQHQTETHRMTAPLRESLDFHRKNIERAKNTNLIQLWWGFLTTRRHLIATGVMSGVAAVPGLAICTVGCLIAPGSILLPGISTTVAGVALMNLVGLRSSLADARHQRALNLVARDFVPGWEVEVARLEKELTELSNNRSYSAFRASYLNDVRENFIASGHSPSSQAYVPVRPAFKNYWRSESPGMVLNERLAILSVFQRAESNPLITGEQRNQLVSLILSQGDYMKGAKSARDWLDKEFPLPPLISVGDLSPRAPR